MNNSNPKATQEQRMLEAFKIAGTPENAPYEMRRYMKPGGWVNGQYFLRVMLMSQFHVKIFNLQKKGYPVEPSDFKDEYGFKYYRLQPAQQSLL